MTLIRASVALLGLLFTANVLAAVGSTPGTFDVNSNGAATYTVPIQVVPGINGMEPHLALTYNSQYGNGLVGVGWSLGGLSSIRRCGGNIAIDGVRSGIDFGADRFCFNGQRLIETSSTSTYREYSTEIKSFSRIRAYGTDPVSPTYFQIWTKDGHLYTLGDTEDSEFELQSNGTLSWSINRLEDRNGNYLTVSYNENETTGEQYVAAIDYTGNGSTTPARQVSFGYESRQDIQKKYIDGGLQTINQRLKTITTSFNSSVVKTYTLDYQTANPDPLVERSQLHTITECGVGNECFDNVLTFTAHDSGSMTYGVASTVNLGAEFNTWSKLADVNGDGIMDIFSVTDKADTETGSGTGAVSVKLGQQGGGYAAGVETSGVITVVIPSGGFSGGFNEFNELVDVDGDGRLDIFRASGTNSTVTVYLGTSSGGFDKTNAIVTSSAATFNSKGFRYKNQLTDMNGDGLMDIFRTTSGRNFSVRYGQINNGDFGFGTAVSFTTNTGSTAILASYDTGSDEGFRAKNLLADANGDGLIDIVTMVGSSSIQIMEAQGDGIFLALGVQSNVLSPANYSGPDYASYLTFLNQFLDVNGDGILDVVRIVPESEPVPVDDQVAQADWGYFYGTYDEGCVAPNSIFSYECDSHKYYGSRHNFEPDLEVLLGDGNGGFNNPITSENVINVSDLSLIPSAGESGVDHPDNVVCSNSWVENVDMVFTMINGFQYQYQYETHAHVGCQPEEYSTTLPKGFTHLNQFADMNNDGIIDLVSVDWGSDNAAGSVSVAYGTGTGSFSSKVVLGQGAAVYTEALQEGFRDRNQLVDLDGDGTVDIFSTDSTGQTGTPRVSNKNSPSLISTIENGLGLTVAVNYKKLTDPTVYTKTIGNDTYPQRKVTTPLSVVQSYNVTDGAFDYNFSYRYKDARVDLQRGWLGFNEIARIDERASQHIETRTRFKQDYPYIGRADLSVTRLYSSTDSMATAADSLSDKLTRIDTAWDEDATGDVHFIFQESQDDYSYDPDDNHSLIIKTTTTFVDTDADDVPYDEYGNPEKVVVTNSLDAHSQETVYTNTYDTTSDFPGQLDDQTITVTSTSPSGSETRTTSRDFDSAGRLISEIQQPGDSLATTTTYTYDSYGHIDLQSTTGWDDTYNTSGTASGSGTTTRTIDYDYLNLTTASWTLTQTNSAGHIESTTFDTALGQPVTHVDPNGITTTWDYDAFGRVEEQIDYTGTTTTSYTTCATNCAAGAKLSITSTPPGTTATIKQYDALERDIRTIAKSTSGSNIYTDTQYDDAGRLWRVSNPYFSGSPVWTTSTYDDAGRLYQTTSPTGMEIRNTYSGMENTVTRITGDEANQATTYTRDSQGQIISINDAEEGTTVYDYGPFGVLAEITDANSNEHTFAYDALGRMIGQDDPDMGVWQYRYNAFGETKWQKDAEAQITHFAYDTLGRMTSRIEDVGNTDITTTWTYDANTATEGLLDNVVRDGVTTTYTYDSNKRPATTTTNTGSKTYTVTTTYDTVSRLDTVTYPDNGANAGPVIKYNYYGNGLLNNITDNASTTYWQATDYTAADQVSAETWGNGVSGTRSYDANSQRVTAIKTGSGNGIQDLGYSYFKSGNLKSRSNDNSSITERFNYDALDRLTSVIPSTGSTVSYEYDAIGNITYKSDLGRLTYDGSTGGVHAVSKASFDGLTQYNASEITAVKNYILDPGGTLPQNCRLDATPNLINILDILCMNKLNADIGSGSGGYAYIYDANGNMTNVTDDAGSSTIRTIAYNAFNKPVSINVTGGSSTTFSYGPDQQRLSKTVTDGSTTTVTTYIGGVYEEIVNGTTTEHRYYISAAGRLVAEIVGDESTTATYYIHTDFLGSTDVMTNASGSPIGSISFDEYGIQRGGDWSGTPDISHTTRGYTGHESDNESGLINMNARLYDPLLGRFISADPTIPNVYNPQSLNRYSYVLNNPFRYTDPTGYTPDEMDYASWLDSIGPVDFEQALTSFDPVSFDTFGFDGSMINTEAVIFGGDVGQNLNLFNDSLGDLVFDGLGSLMGTASAGEVQNSGQVHEETVGFGQEYNHWNAKNVNSTRTVEIYKGDPSYEDIYDEGEWTIYNADTVDLTDFIPQKKFVWVVRFATYTTNEARLVEYRQFHDYEVYEYNVIYDLNNGNVENLMFEYGSRTYINTISKPIPNTQRFEVETRTCWFGFLGC